MPSVDVTLVINGLTFNRSYDSGYNTEDINNDVAATVLFMDSQERLFIEGEMGEAPDYEKKSGD
jgi:hypothetical protein